MCGVAAPLPLDKPRQAYVVSECLESVEAQRIAKECSLTPNRSYRQDRSFGTQSRRLVPWRWQRMRILYVAMQYDYGNPSQGYSFEHYNFYDSLRGMGHEILYFDFLELEQVYGRDEMNRS